MNPHPPFPSLPKPRSARRDGVALIVVLFLLILVTALVVAFFSASLTETQSTAASVNLARIERLRELPLEIVKTQIYNATTLGQTGTPDKVTNTWASQPGLIRVFNSAGNLERAYKLYSSAKMEETDTAFLATEIPDDWNTRPGRYVNLNQPFPSLNDPGKTVYPILNPDAVHWAEGLSIGADPAGKTDATMPVEWLYVLQDGTLLPQDQITDKSNPPTARIAFWTDDESCKVNINTAGERTFWDRPRAGHDKNYQFRYNQPSTGEYNAYPGHPATVSLSALFGKALTGSTRDEIVKTMLSLTPRYAWGGSQNGTIPTYQPRIELDRTKPGAVLKNDRLFATESEFLLTTARTVADERLKQPIQESGFLLTESSHAPELNLFGMPRVGLWPIDTDLTKRTVYDNLIARGTTVGSQPFYFQRNDPFLMNEAEGIPRNWSLLEYLDKLTSLPVPGFGGKFSTKYGTDGNRQILTEMFDYIRSGVNLCDTSRPQSEFSKQFTPATSTPSGYVLPTRVAAWGTRGFGRVPVITNVGLVLYAYDQSGYTGSPPDTLPSDAETKVHMLLWFNFVTPMMGVAPLSATYKIVLKNYTFGLSDVNPVGVPQYFVMRNTTCDRFVFTDQGKDWGGYETMVGQGSGQEPPGGPPFKDGYEFHSQDPITIKGDTMNFYGGDLKLEIYDSKTGELLQTYTLNFPSSLPTAPWPAPLAWQQTDNAEKATATLFWDRDPRNAKTRDSDQLSNDTNYVLGTRRTGTRARALDVIRGVELKHGDARLVACMDSVPYTMFQPSKGYFDGSRRIASSLLFSRNVSNITRLFGSEFGKFADVQFHDETRPPAENYAPLANRPPLPAEVDGVPLTSLRDMGWSGDIDGGMLGEPDGPFLNKPDEGFISTEDPSVAKSGTQDPYFRAMVVTVDGKKIRSWDPRENGFFSPTRQMPSAIQFGSLPTGVLTGDPWRTLLFSPNSQAAMVPDKTGQTGHPGANAPHDHLYLDLFTMPVVEPYAISEPFSTAGKINLNQRLIPFSYIKRETGLHSVLENMQMIATESDNPTISAWYKTPNTTPDRWHLLRGVDVEKTLSEIAKVLDPAGIVGAGAFRSATEICKIFLIPNDQDAKTSADYWSKHQLTADNSREAPYNDIYPLLTTQSNTYQVHYRVQTLTPLKGKAAYDPAKDFVVTGEQRGESTLERYLDINDPRFEGASPEVNATAASLTEYYKFRVLRHSTFTSGL